MYGKLLKGFRAVPRPADRSSLWREKLHRVVVRRQGRRVQIQASFLLILSLSLPIVLSSFCCLPVVPPLLDLSAVRIAVEAAQGKGVSGPSLSRRNEGLGVGSR
jgi:hypothetical protein